MKKTWRIGEYAIGGIIKAEIRSSDVRISCNDWNNKEQVFGCTADRRSELLNRLNDWTSSYWADEVMQWIDSKIRLEW